MDSENEAQILYHSLEAIVYIIFHAVLLVYQDASCKYLHLHFQYSSETKRCECMHMCVYVCVHAYIRIYTHSKIKAS